MTDDKGVLKRALVELRELREKLAAARPAKDEPIAIIGMGCRFPGHASSPAALWELLEQGVDATSEVPPDRWDAAAYHDPDAEAPGKMITRRGGFIDDPAGFDERFFDISAREARSMDPQQRLLLEVAWEALEHAGLAPDRLAHTRTGLYFGMSGSDYAHLLTALTPIDELDAYLGLGTAFSFGPGRLAYHLGLQGPSLALDSACSSSLVAVHLACQSLRAGESDLALAGGVNLILTPTAHVVLSKAGVLSREGRCKTFDASADGYARGEGAGAVVLRRLADAVAAGDSIWAVIRGSAVNQDGPSSGLTVPNGAAQEAVIRAALAAAGVAPADIDYVEAHGTATPLGDPIEVRALAAALGAGRPRERPLLVGSVKTNVGHLEATAGVAGLIKAALALHHRTIPAHLHFRTPNPHIDWERLPVRVPVARQPWPARPGEDRLPLAGVSSFGASGTNAHVVLEAATLPRDRQPAAHPAAGPELLVLSAKSEEALRALADRHEQALASVSLPDACFTAAVGRARLPHRLAVAAATADDARGQLEAFARGEAGGLAGVVRGDPPRIAFLFTGQGAQSAGMGRGLFEREPVFRRALEECDALLRPHLARPLLSVLYDAGPTLIDETQHAQPALLALGWALAALWRSWGIEPAAVLGHSVGELTAACVAGALPLPDALRLVAERGRLMQALPGDGAMAALFAGEDTVGTALPVGVSIAALNGPNETVVSGPRAAVARLVADLASRGVRGRHLTVSHAFHSGLMEPMLDPFERAAAAVTNMGPRVAWISNVTGGPVGEGGVDASYWRRHVRAPVRFAQGITALARLGASCFVELGPSPVLLGMARRCLSEGAGVYLPSLREKRDDRAQMLDSLGALWVRGAPVDWDGFYRGRGGRKIALPTYPFQRRRHWLAEGTSSPVRSRSPSSHSLLGVRLTSPALRDVVYETELTAARAPALRDHRLFGHVVVSGVVHMALVAAALEDQSRPVGSLACEDVRFQAPLVLDERGARVVQTILTPGGGFQIASQDQGGAWLIHTSGTIRPAVEVVPAAARDPSAIQKRCGEARDGRDFYERLLGAEAHWLGPSYRTVQRLWRRDGEVLAELALPPDDVLCPPGCGLDVAMLRRLSIGEVYGQVLLPAVPDYERVAVEAGDTFVGHSMAGSIDHVRDIDRARWCHALLAGGGGDEYSGDLALLDATGQVLAEVRGLRVRRISRVLVKHAVAASARRTPRARVTREALAADGPAGARRYLLERVAAVLGVGAAAIQPADVPRDLGLDSLMAIELRDAVAADLSVALPLAEVAGGATITDLATWLSGALGWPSG